MTPLDLAPAAQRMSALVGGVSDDQLGGVTPCPAYTLGDLLDHVGGAAIAFTAAAHKTIPPGGSQRPSGDASRLEEGWRDRVRRDLDALAAAWADPGAWTGTAVAGGVEMPGEVAGLVVLDELVVHGWDVARSTGQPFDVDPSSLEAVHGFVAQFSGEGQGEIRSGLFGPVVPVRDDAPLLDRVLGMAGRDPGWSPSAVVG